MFLCVKQLVVRQCLNQQLWFKFCRAGGSKRTKHHRIIMGSLRRVGTLYHYLLSFMHPGVAAINKQKAADSKDSNDNG